MNAPFKIHQSPHAWSQNNPTIKLGNMVLSKGALSSYALLKSRTADDPSRFYVVPNGDPADGTRAAIKVFFDDYDADYLAGGFNYRDFGIYADTARKGVSGGGTCFLNAKTNGAYFGFNPEIVLSRSDGNEICLRAVTVNAAISEAAMAAFVAKFRGYHKPGRAYSIGDAVCSATGVGYIAASAGIAGATPPSHLAGTASDGAVNWTFQFDHAAGGGVDFRMFTVIGRKDDTVYWTDPIVKESGLQLTRDTAVHNARGVYFLGATGVPVGAISSVGNSVYVGNSARTKGVRVDHSGDGFVQHVGVAELLGNSSITSNVATPSVAECSHLTFGNTVATTVTQFLGGKAFQRIVVRGGNTNTTLQHGTYIRLKGNQSRRLLADDALEFVFNSAGTVATELQKESGRRKIFSAYGDTNTPLETLSGITTGNFATKVEIPPYTINPGERVIVEGLVRKNNTNGTAIIHARLGTLNSSGDNTFGVFDLSNSNDRDYYLHAFAGFGSSLTSYVTSHYLVPGLGATATVATRATNVNIGASMWVGVYLSAANASDTFDLIALSVYVE